MKGKKPTIEIELKVGDRVCIGYGGTFLMEISNIEERTIADYPDVQYFAFTGKFVQPDGTLGHEHVFYKHDIYLPNGVVRRE